MVVFHSTAFVSFLIEAEQLKCLGLATDLAARLQSGAVGDSDVTTTEVDRSATHQTRKVRDQLRSYFSNVTPGIWKDVARALIAAIPIELEK